MNGDTVALPANFDLLDESHLQALIAAGAAEGPTLEFKAAPYGTDHDGAREFLKDVTALANTNGGVLLIGITELDGVAAGLKPVDPTQIDGIRLRLESLLQSAVEPRIYGLQIRAIPVSEGSVIALKVPRSVNPPHRVTAKNSNRFYLRSSAGVYEASIDELRSLFLQTSDIREKVLIFRERRLAAIRGNAGSVVLAQDPRDRLVVHIAPMSALGIVSRIDLNRATENEHFFRPMGRTGYSPRFNLDGFILTRGGTACHGYTQVFREGFVEATKVGIVGGHNGTPAIPGRSVIDTTVSGLAGFIEGLGRLGATPPFFVTISLLNVGGSFVGTPRQLGIFFEPPELLREPDLLLPPAIIETFGNAQSYSESLKPSFDALWNAGELAEWTPDGQESFA